MVRAFVLFVVVVIQFIMAEVVDINVASVDELVQIGFSRKLAVKLIKYREKIGGFSTIYDILKVPGIDGEFFVRVKNKITVRREKGSGSLKMVSLFSSNYEFKDRSKSKGKVSTGKRLGVLKGVSRKNYSFSYCVKKALGFLKLGNVDVAGKWLKVAQKRITRSSNAYYKQLFYYLKGAYYEEKGMFEKAADSYDRLTGKWEALGLWRKGVVLWKSGDYARARLVWGKMKEMWPDCPFVEKAREIIKKVSGE